MQSSLYPFQFTSLHFYLYYYNINKCKYILVMFRGYIEAVREIEQQLQTGNDEIKFDDIVVACGRFCVASIFGSKNT